METFDLTQEYNGYTNFPTWMIALMLDNERECYDKIMADCDWLNGIPDMTHKQRVHQLARKIEDYFNHLPHGVVDFKWWTIWKGDFEYHGILKAIYGKNPILVDWEQIASENFGEFLTLDNSSEVA